MFRLFRRTSQAPAQPPDAWLVYNLLRIGVLKEPLPLAGKGQHQKLGLYVQLMPAPVSARLMAGRKWHHHFSLYLNRSHSLKPWRMDRVDRYEPGPWEALVEPSLELAAWLHVDHDEPVAALAAIDAAVLRYRESGEWQLVTPERKADVDAALFWSADAVRAMLPLNQLFPGE